MKTGIRAFAALCVVFGLSLLSIALTPTSGSLRSPSPLGTPPFSASFNDWNEETSIAQYMERMLTAQDPTRMYEESRHARETRAAMETQEAHEIDRARTVVPAERDARRELLHEKLGIPLAELDALDADAVQQLMEDNACVLGLQMFRLNDETGEMELVAGGEANCGTRTPSP